LAKTSKLFLDEADEIIIVKSAKTFKIKKLFVLKLLSLIILKLLIDEIQDMNISII